MTRFQFALEMTILSSLTTPVAWSGDLIMDHNVGGGAMIEVINFEDGASNFLAAGGAVASVETLMTLEEYANADSAHYYIFDGRFMSFIGGGVNSVSGADGETVGVFKLKLVGNLGGGVQAFRFIPLNLTAEDVMLDIENADINLRTLLGTTVYLPGEILELTDDQNLFIAVTFGVRLNTDASEAAVGVQPKIRYMSDLFSAEARALFTLGDTINEKTGALSLGLNHLGEIGKSGRDIIGGVLGHGSQLGVMVEARQFEDNATGRAFNSFSALVFLGGDL